MSMRPLAPIEYICIASGQLSFVWVPGATIMRPLAISIGSHLTLNKDWFGKSEKKLGPYVFTVAPKTWKLTLIFVCQTHFHDFCFMFGFIDFLSLLLRLIILKNGELHGDVIKLFHGFFFSHSMKADQ